MRAYEIKIYETSEDGSSSKIKDGVEVANDSVCAIGMFAIRHKNELQNKDVKNLCGSIDLLSAD